MDIYKSFYTKSKFITDYMIKMLYLEESDLVLEPSAGEGVFIDEILKRKPNIKLTAYDINPDAINILNEKYKKLDNVEVVYADTLLDDRLDDFSMLQSGYYDKIIGNPPYGAWQDQEKRNLLKRKYKEYYVKETYTLFLLRCISLLKEQGRLSFIIPDTFMNLHMHSKLREFMLLNTKVVEIVMFPSSFFPGVNYGYAGMCMITVEKTYDYNEALNNDIRVIKGLREPINITDITNNENLSNYKIEELKQKEIFQSVDKAFYIKAGQGIRNLINDKNTTRLEDLADCVTGIYTGDNKRYFKVANDKVKNNIGKCPTINKEEISYDYLNKDNLLQGIEGKEHFIPVVKGSASKYIRSNDWFIDWSVEAVNAYNTNKKARFQNSSYYFKKGIALPMVKSKSIRANLIENQVFDQSVVGVFPKDERLLYYLLGFFNTKVFDVIIHTINPTANNSANYIKKVPVIIKENDIEYINGLVEEIISKIRDTGEIDVDIDAEIEKYFKDLYSEWLDNDKAKETYVLN